jgi:hypothetical protein
MSMGHAIMGAVVSLDYSELQRVSSSAIRAISRQLSAFCFWLKADS